MAINEDNNLIKSSNSLKTAIESHKKGDLAKAEQTYRQILRQDPRNSDALYLLGVIAHQVGKYESAAACIRRALVIKPDAPVYHLNLGNACKEMGDLKSALNSYAEALMLKPDFADAHLNCGIVYEAMNQPERSVYHYRKALDIKPDYAQAHNNLGRACRARQDMTAAEDHFRAAVRFSPEYPFAHNNLANILKDKKDLEGALRHYKMALAKKPDYVDAHFNLAMCLRESRSFGAAISHLREVIRLDSNHVDAHKFLGVLLKQGWYLDQAIQHFREVLRLQPDRADMINNIGGCLKSRGLIEEALEYYAKALELQPDFPYCRSNYLLALHYHPDPDAEVVFSEHRKWARIHEAPLAPSLEAHANEPEPQRRLRIGYVSPDFYMHSVANFLLPVFENHNLKKFEIFCYSNVVSPDKVTHRFEALADHWVDITQMSDPAAAALIREHGIDILVDLAGHTAYNRLQLFAYKPAPVQVTWLGYPNTSGLEAMDYRLTDRYVDPPGPADDLHTERLVRLPGSFLCYRPYLETPEPAVRERQPNQPARFASFSNFSKMSPRVVECWADILRQSPGARLVLKSRELTDQKNRDRCREMIEGQGIDSGRIDILPGTPSAADHFECYHQADISLDPFPYNGTTMICEALWMGLPVIVLAGDSHVSRVGAGLLRCVGLSDLVAANRDEYVEKAVRLAGDAQRLAWFRKNLRGRVRRSPLGDGAGFSNHLEEAYRSMWQQWCQQTRKRKVA